MHMIWQRYSRSGYAPRWYYVAMAFAFGALAVWALVTADWVVAAVAAAMAGVVVLGSGLMRRLAVAADASARELEARRRGGPAWPPAERDDGRHRDER
jgi:hypothetical protein